MRRYSSSKDIQKLVQRLIQEGWSFEPGRRHHRIYPSHGRSFLVIPGTPSDCRAFINFSADARRLGLNNRSR